MCSVLLKHKDLSKSLVLKGSDMSYKNQNPRYSWDPTLMPEKTFIRGCCTLTLVDLEFIHLYLYDERALSAWSLAELTV